MIIPPDTFDDLSSLVRNIGAGRLAPAVLATLTDASLLNPWTVYVTGHYCYMAGVQSDTVCIFDVTNPEEPELLGSVQDAALLNGVSGIHVAGKYLYAACQSYKGVTVVDISNPSVPVIVGTVQDMTNLDGARKVRAVGRYAFVPSQTAGRLTVVDVADPTAPVVIGSVTHANLTGTHDVTIVGKYAYVCAAVADALVIVDVSDPTAPAVAGSVTDALLDGAASVKVRGRYAYIAGATSNRLVIVDISDPAAPVVVNSITHAALLSPQYLDVAERYAFLACQTGTAIVVVDVTDVSALSVVAVLQDAVNLEALRELHIVGPYLYCACRTPANRLTIVKLSSLDVPLGRIGNLEVGRSHVDDNLDVTGPATFRTGIRVGPQGLFCEGPINLASGQPLSVPELNVTGLTANSLTYHTAAGEASVGAATNGQLPIGSTGAAPVLAAIAGTANQVTVTNGAGSITLSAPQNLHTAATPTFSTTTISTASAAAYAVNGAAGPRLILSNPNNTNDNYGSLDFQSLSSTGVTRTFGRVMCHNRSHTNTAETADLVFVTQKAGTQTEHARITAEGNLTLGVTAAGASGAKVIAIGNGTAPGAITDGVQAWSQDRAGDGTACLHVKEEAGHTIKLFRGAALTAANAGVINSGDATTDAVIENIRTRVNELEARLQAVVLVA